MAPAICLNVTIQLKASLVAIRKPVQLKVPRSAFLALAEAGIGLHPAGLSDAAQRPALIISSLPETASVELWHRRFVVPRAPNRWLPPSRRMKVLFALASRKMANGKSCLSQENENQGSIFGPAEMEHLDISL